MLKFSRESDAKAVAKTLGECYPSYVYIPVKLKGARLWRLALHCKATGAFLQYAKY